MACIRKMNGKFRVDINKKGFPRIAKRFLDLKTARRWAKEIELQMERNQFDGFTSSGTTLKEILIKYRDEKTILKKGCREETSKINLIINHNIALHGIMMLKSHHIHKFMKDLGKTRKPNTINKYVNIICHAWRVAKKEWGISVPRDNPCDMVTMNRYNDSRDRVLTIEEYQKLLEKAELSNLPQLKDIIEFAYHTGARRGEILRMSRNHVDWNRKVITFYDTKNGEDRTIPLSEKVLSILKKYRFGDRIFPISEYRIEKHFRIARKRAEITDFRLHDLRACFITNAFLSGLSVAEVSALSGHKSWSELKRYSRIKPEDLLGKVNNIVSISKKVNG
ncbi:MAG: hypothetical protein CME98_16730 [Hyphomonas sp.]|nr:hypothetical protein [Hyphomonas sp.]